MAARGMEGLSDFWKVTVLKKASFVPESPFAPASAGAHPTFGRDGKRLGCLTQSNRGLMWWLCPSGNSGSPSPPQKESCELRFSVLVVHTEFQLCCILSGQRQQEEKGHFSF